MAKKKIKILEGYGYPKEKILELVDTFGLFVDLDRWDDKDDKEDEGFLRIESSCAGAGCVIVHKHHLEVEVHREAEHLRDLFQKFLMKIGEIEFKKKLNDLIKIETFQ